MDVKSIPLTANERTRIHQPGRFFILIETAAELDVVFEKNRTPIGEVGRSVESGYKRFPGDWSNVDEGNFDSVVLTSPSTQTVVVGISETAADYTRVVSVVKVDQPTTQNNVTQKTVTTIQTVVVSNASRRRLHLQNTHGSLDVRIGGAGLTVFSGLLLKPGMSFSTDSTAGWNAISVSGAAVTVAVLEES